MPRGPLADRHELDCLPLGDTMSWTRTTLTAAVLMIVPQGPARAQVKNEVTTKASSSPVHTATLPGRSLPRYTRRSPVVDVVSRVRGAVVNIHSERSAKAGEMSDFYAYAPSNNRVNGMGTGIIIDPRGYLVTNHHVVEEV